MVLTGHIIWTGILLLSIFLKVSSKLRRENWQNLSPKKEPVTPVAINELCTKFAGPYASLSDLCLATICVTAYAAFLLF